MPTILMTAPYMIPFLERFEPVFAKYGLDLIVPEVQERMEEADLLKYAGQFDGAICGDDKYTARVLEACSPRLKVISKWGTGIDSIDTDACSHYGVKVCRTPNAFTLPVADTVLGGGGKSVRAVSRLRQACSFVFFRAICDGLQGLKNESCDGLWAEH